MNLIVANYFYMLYNIRNLTTQVGVIIMRFKILGSGGVQQIPRPCCTCKICTEAKAKGFPYKRLTQSLFLHDINAIFDTPECICEELNIYAIPSVSNIFYTHFHPDHTLGCRVIEALRSEKNLDKINVFMPPEGIRISINTFDSFIDYYVKQGYCNIIKATEVIINNIRITPIRLDNQFAYSYLIEENGKRLFYCPCHAKYIPYNIKELENVDIMLLGLGHFRFINNETTNFKLDIIPLIEKYKPKLSVFTHIEETDEKSFDDYKKLEKYYSKYNILFAYDGMDLIL